PRLADVVRGARGMGRESLARALLRAAPRRLASRPRAPRVEPVSRASPALRAGDSLRLPLHGFRRAASDRRLVAARRARAVLPGLRAPGARARRLTLTQAETSRPKRGGPILRGACGRASDGRGRARAWSAALRAPPARRRSRRIGRAPG